MSQDFAERAIALVGTRFRPQGRIETGLDCIGLVLAAFGIPLDAARRDYRLRGAYRSEVEQGLGRFFKRVPNDWGRPGDVLLMSVASDQLHLGICTPTGFVHADARIGRVVETPGCPVWPIIGTYRRRGRPAKSR
jgi:hypothetical protein